MDHKNGFNTKLGYGDAKAAVNVRVLSAPLFGPPRILGQAYGKARTNEQSL